MSQRQEFDEVVYLAPFTEKVLRTLLIGIGTGATPSVENLERLQLRNSISTDITNFLRGKAGQTIKILGDGYSTIKNNANISTNTGADKLTSASKVYTFTMFRLVDDTYHWIEDA